MKATLKLDNLETTRGGTQFVNLILKMEFKRDYSDTLTVKLRAGGINIRIMSDHLLHEMKNIVLFLDEDNRIKDFANEILAADKKLNETISL